MATLYQTQATREVLLHPLNQRRQDYLARTQRTPVTPTKPFGKRHTIEEDREAYIARLERACRLPMNATALQVATAHVARQQLDAIAHEAWEGTRRR